MLFRFAQQPRPIEFVILHEHPRQSLDNPSFNVVGSQGANNHFGWIQLATGEVYARLSLAFLLNVRGRAIEVLPELERAAEVAEVAGDAILKARALVGLAWNAYNRQLYGRAWALFKQVELLVFPEGPPDLQSGTLSGLGGTCWATGRYREAQAYYRRNAELLHRGGDAFGHAGALYNVALLASKAGAEWEPLMERALEAAERSQNRSTEAAARLDLAGTLESLDARRNHCRRALELSDGRSRWSWRSWWRREPPSSPVRRSEKRCAG